MANLKRQNNPKAHLPYQVGEMNNSLTLAQVMLADMVRISDNFSFVASDQEDIEFSPEKL